MLERPCLLIFYFLLTWCHGESTSYALVSHYGIMLQWAYLMSSYLYYFLNLKPGESNVRTELDVLSIKKISFILFFIFKKKSTCMVDSSNCN